MKKRKFFLLLIAIMLTCIGLYAHFFSKLNKEDSRENFFEKEYLDDIMKEFILTESKKSISEYIFSDGCIQTPEDAEKVSKVILKSVFGDRYDDYGLPLMVFYDDDNQNWLVKTQLPEDMLGGAKYIILKKSNAEVVAIWAEA